MSKILLLVLGISIMTHDLCLAQPSCPQITGLGILQHPSNPCDKRVRFSYINPNNGQKRIRLEVRTNNILVINECIDASGNPGQAQSFTSSNFTQCTLSGIEVRITPFNGNNCNGNGCPPFIRVLNDAPLAVEFASFTAQRWQRTVRLEWTTASESDCKGFAVERNTGGNWEQVGYVPSRSPGGTSAGTLAYLFSDRDPSPGALRYRLRQEDLNGETDYSETRFVAAMDQAISLNLYPNPSCNGTVSADLGNAAVRQICLFDFSGRIIRQWSQYGGTRLTIREIPNGNYVLRVASPSGEVMCRTFVVAARD